MAKPVPLTDQFIKAGLSKGWLVPPRDGPGKPPERMLLEWSATILVLIGLCCLGVVYGMTR